MITSLSVWRVWIEIKSSAILRNCLASLSVWRVWIEIVLFTEAALKYLGHSLYGECGLKYCIKYKCWQSK